MPTRSRRRRLLVRIVAAGGGLLFLLVAVLAVEVVLAGRGLVLAERDPHTIDGRVEPDPRAPSGSAGDPLRIVWLGDSTAAGVGTSSPDGAVARQVARRLGRSVDVEVLAVSGARVGDVRRDQVPQVASRPAGEAPDVVVVSVGANDVTHLTSSGAFRDDYDAVLRSLPSESAVLVLGVPDIGSATRLAQPLRWIAGARGGQLDEVVRDVARAEGAGYVDIAGGTGPSFRADPDRYFAADHYHPNDAGYGVWADAIVPVLRDRLGA